MRSKTKRGASQSAKSAELDREIQLAHEQALRNAAQDAEIQVYVDNWKAEQIAPVACGAMLGICLIALSIYLLWAITTG